MLALLLGDWAPSVDRNADQEDLLGFSPASARDTLSAVATGMISFTGFVLAVVLLVLQFGSTAFSPRVVRSFRRDRVVKHALGVFVATFVYALYVITDVESDEIQGAEFTVVLSLALLLASVFLFLALIHRVTENLRVAGVLRRIARDADRAVRRAYPHALGAAPAVEWPVDAFELEAIEVRHAGEGAVVKAVDRRALAALGARAGGVVSVVPALGDHVPRGAVLAEVRGTREVSERAVRRAIVLGDERTIEADPGFALRLFVEIGARATSQAINDPGTAVAALDRIEDLLRALAARALDTRAMTGRDGRVHATIPVPGWEDYVVLGIDEIRRYGADDLQVARRLRALLDDLLAAVPAERRPALEAARARLEASVEAHFGDPADHALARVADRHGLGFAR